MSDGKADALLASVERHLFPGLRKEHGSHLLSGFTVTDLAVKGNQVRI
jgi:hypothetical protein